MIFLMLESFNCSQRYLADNENVLFHKKNMFFSDRFNLYLHLIKAQILGFAVYMI